MFWTYRVSRNLAALGTLDPEYSPGWAVGFYFIPILNLFRPYQAMVEIWTGSNPNYLGSQLKRQVSVPLLNLWWGVWICSAIIGRVMEQSGRGEQAVDELIVQNYLVLAVVLLLEVPRDLLSLWLVRTLSSAQDERYEKITASSPVPAHSSSTPFAFEAS